MSAAPAKRFYERVATRPAGGGGYEILLDQRPLRTPGKAAARTGNRWAMLGPAGARSRVRARSLMRLRALTKRAGLSGYLTLATALKEKFRSEGP